jgi:isoprenylcysteine carboxyl methyltransferase (ICMT) family protein YpbQ
MEVLTVIFVASLVVAIHLLGLRAGRRWGTRRRESGDARPGLRRIVWFCALAALGVVAVMVWGNTGDRSMNSLGWARYALFLVIFIALGAWALARTRSR